MKSALLRLLCIGVMSGTAARGDQPQIPKLSVPSYKGMDYGWGSNTFGSPAYEHWLTDAYDPATVVRDLDAMATAGTLTISAWLFLDRCIVKDSRWGSPDYIVTFYPECISHWEDFLRQLNAHHMAAIVNLLNRGDQVGSSLSSVERAAFPPAALDSALLGPGVRNGDMVSAAANGFPVGWASDGTGQAVLMGPGGGLTAKGNYLSVTAGIDSQFVRTPVVPFTGDRLLALSVPVRGKIRSVTIFYYAVDGSVITSDEWLVDNDFGAVWNVLPLGTAGRGLTPAGVAYIALRVEVPAAGLAAIGPVQIGNGERNQIWRNYLSVITAWVSRYSGATDLGKAIAGWQVIDEGYAGVTWSQKWGKIAPAFLHSFYADAYLAVRTVPSAQPVGVESSAGSLPLWAQDSGGDLVNMKYYADIADYYNLHLFDDAGTIPPGVSRFARPWLVGEAGASADGSPSHFSDPSQPYEANAVSSFLANGAVAGAAAVMPWTYNTNPNLIYIDKEQVFFGPAGQYIRDFHSAANRNAASFATGIAPGSIVAAFGSFTVNGTLQAAQSPLPETLGGLTVGVTDAKGISWAARLIYVSPTQVLYVVPTGAATGLALVTISGPQGFAATGLFTLTAVAPGIFSADGSGGGPAAAVVARYNSGTFLSWTYTATIDPKTAVPVSNPIDLSIAGDLTILELYGVGVRNSGSPVVARLSSGETLAVQYAGPAPGFSGLDQINVLLPGNLAGKGVVSIQLIADGLASNAVYLEFR